jgi:type II secretory pathway pseudopilin PulG
MPRLTQQTGGPRRVKRAGLTLVELLVTLVLIAGIGTIVSKMMLDQQRFYQRMNEQMGVRRELRSAMSMMPGDMRSLSSVGGDIISFDATTLRYRSTIGASIICAKAAANTLDIPPLDMARTTLTAWSSTPVAGDTVYAFRADSMGAGGDSWTAHRIVSVTPSSALCAASPYIDALDLGKARYRLVVSPDVADSVKVGAAIRFLRSTEYSVVAGESGKYYVGRSEYIGGAWSAPTPVLGPFTAPTAAGTGGMRFAMFDSTGAEVSPAGNLSSISRIDLTLRGEGSSSSGKVAGKTDSKDSIAFRIALRNRQ